MTRDADVIIVGAGPAGAVTALLLARAGHDVLLLDRAAFPRPKPCGDCLSAGATGVLARLGLLDRVRAVPHARLTGWRIAAPGGAMFSAAIASPPGYALAIERAHLDAALVAAAVDAGARLREGVRVNDLDRAADGAVRGVVTAGETVRAPLVVGADGLRSVVARRLRAVRRPARLRKLSLTVHADVDILAEAIGEMHTGRGVCVGIAPVRDGRSNLTVVADARRFGRLVATDAPAFIRSAVQAMPRLRGRLPDARLAALLDGAAILASGPFDRPVRAVTFDGATLAGDAAGYYDPFTGQGVCHALLGAELLARTADVALRNRDCSASALRPYAHALRTTLRAPRAMQHVVEALLARPAVAEPVIARIARAPAAADALIAVIGHTAPAASLLSARVLTDLFTTARRRTA
jgi:menaquinone-9 beta-reductase